MRYVWNRNLNQAVLTRGTSYYAFTSFSDKVIRGKEDGSYELMPLPARFQTMIHIPSVYLLETFGCEGMNIKDTDFGVLVTAELRAMAEELLEIYLRGFF